MPNKMLIDASHPEETRVVVVRGNRIEEFDFESQDKKQLKGNIYLARVTRVEPSLQAAFVEYGGNRHGFLAFSEIHPDYYQIPLADRQALLRAEAEASDSDDDEDGDGDDRSDRNRNRRRRRGGKNRGREHEKREGESVDESSASGDEVSVAEQVETEQADAAIPEAAAETVAQEAEQSVESTEEATADEAAAAEETDEARPEDVQTTSIAASIEADVISEAVSETTVDAPPADEDRGTVEEVSAQHGDEGEVESVGAEDALEEIRNRRKPMRRHYKIQEVIKRRQILLVQVVKEERGNKGAALTTYLSLAGRYSVLMPNTARGGGISRKITNAQDRKRLKEVVQDLEVPEGMGVILRTAGESRTKAEIKRDYEYLMRLWENVRSLTLQSTAPALVYEEGSLIKRSVRDLYNKDIDEILVSGEEGYREAKDFMRMLMPSHAKVVQPFRDSTPIFARNGIEAQLDRMLQPQVTLKSGGYIIINQTEALVSIDVNSGRSTKEHSIEDTALQTNLEAAEEVARQLRLRDLAGLIVIDFIDMEENRNNRAVEKKLKDCLKNDRARIQVGRISHFGLLEMSRQRIRASVLESTMKPCPHCGGTGHVRSDSSIALLVVRAIEEFLLKDPRHHITVRTPTATALYVLNHKRSTLVDLERRFGLTITLEADDSVGSQHYAIFRGAVVEKPVEVPPPAPLATYIEPEEPEDEIVEDETAEEASDEGERQEDGESQRDRKRRRRRRRRGRDRDRDGEAASEDTQLGEAAESSETAEGEEEAEAVTAEADEAAADSEGERKKRRRGKRGGRRHRHEDEELGATSDESAEASETPVIADAAESVSPEAIAEAATTETVVEVAAPAEVSAPADAVEETPAEKPKRKPRRTTKAKKAEQEAAEAEAVVAEPAAAEHAVTEAVETPSPVAEEAPARPTRARASRRKVAAEPAVAAEPVVQSEPVVVSSTAEQAEPADDAKPKKAGWWQRKGFF